MHPPKPPSVSLFLRLGVLAALLPAGSAHAACAEADYPDLDDRLNCFDTFLTLIDGNMTSMASGQATIGGLISADLSVLATESYVDDAVAGVSGGIAGLSDYLVVDTATDSVVFSGANVYVQSGSGSTDGAVNGLGNLLVGYDEDNGDDKSGSHNLVVGQNHTYTSYGGFVAGGDNAVTERLASVIGGRYNTASGYRTSASGGYHNETSHDYSAAAGGNDGASSSTYDVLF